MRELLSALFCFELAAVPGTAVKNLSNILSLYLKVCKFSF